jgi:hypothetical protein
MSTDKVKFSLDVKENNKMPFYFILAVIVLFLLIPIIGLIINHRPQSEINARYTAQEWSKATLQSNDSMKYELLTEEARGRFLDYRRDHSDEADTNYHFENYDIIQWKKDKNNIVYKVHYYGLKSCADCQKDVWVHVVKKSVGWKVPDYNFSNTQAEKFIKNLSGETVYSSPDEDEEEKPIMERIFQRFL